MVAVTLCAALVGCDRAEHSHGADHSHKAEQSHGADHASAVGEVHNHDDHDHHHHSEFETQADGSGHQHGAHVHGQAEMNLALDGKHLRISLELPAMDLLGFERLPHNDEERAHQAQVLEKLQQPASIFSVAEAAGCVVSQVKIESPLLEAVERLPGGVHLDFLLSYDLACAQPDELRWVQVNAFAHFDSLQRIHLNWVREQEQGAALLTAQQARAEFR